MKLYNLLAIACLSLFAFGACSDKGDEKPPVLGTAQYDGETVYFISSTFRENDPQWNTGTRIDLMGYNTIRYPALTDYDYILHLWLGETEAMAEEYVNADISEIESLSIQIVGKCFYYKDFDEDGALTPGHEHFSMESGTFSLRKVVNEGEEIMVSFDLRMSDGKTFKGGATIPMGSYRPVKSRDVGVL